MNITKNQKRLIELAQTTDDADKYIEQFTKLGKRDFVEKLDFLAQTFNIILVGRGECCGATMDDIIATDYEAALTTLINAKWR